ncbi:BTB/POZ protein [Glomus cerebriforme]|uniref:BTB/POZ protein n=1 Tax=Glomus cerebriforme TaxID=658196 RepID=A0A397SHZ6_9GLOM|nr:BTB/POZ protein [Glomus cerebriforme]
MMRGSLAQDLRLLTDNPKYSDIKLYGCRAILAARSEVFDSLLYNGMKESYGNQISFPTINSSVMKVILEYTYTGSVKEESLTKDNIVEAFCAADYFQLTNFQIFIMNTLQKRDYSENYLPELLSKIVKTMP